MCLDFSKDKLPYLHLAQVMAKPGVPVSYAVVCDAPIDEASACIPLLDAAITMSTSFSEDRKTFYFTYKKETKWLLSGRNTGQRYALPRAGKIYFVRDRSLLAQPFDVAHMELTGKPEVVVAEELEGDPAFARYGFSVSDDGFGDFSVCR